MHASCNRAERKVFSRIYKKHKRGPFLKKTFVKCTVRTTNINRTCLIIIGCFCNRSFPSKNICFIQSTTTDTKLSEKLLRVNFSLNLLSVVLERRIKCWNVMFFSLLYNSRLVKLYSVFGIIFPYFFPYLPKIAKYSETSSLLGIEGEDPVQEETLSLSL